MTYAVFRTSGKIYRRRPPANCRAARAAWDLHEQRGAVVWLRLLDGYWGAERPNGEIDEIEAAVVLSEV